MCLHRFLPSLMALCASILSTCASTPEGTAETCIPASERARNEYGCFIVATAEIGMIEDPATYWRIVRFPSQSDARAVARTQARATVVEAFGDVWLFTVGPAGEWPEQGERVAEVGPLPVRSGIPYAARYMEAVFPPGWRSRVHTHPGPEAWYTLTGAICLETPEGTSIGEAGGESVIVPEGPPMRLTAVGTEIRRSLVIVLHDASRPASIPVTDWEPHGPGCDRLSADPG